MTTTFVFARQKNRELEIIVTGSGRSGTGFAAKWLTSVGIPTGHERFFDYRGLRYALLALEQRDRILKGESSWEAAPFLDSRPLRHALVVHQVRHPKRVLESSMRAPEIAIPHYLWFLEQHMSQIRRYSDNLNRAACRWIYWNKMIEDAVQDRESYFWRVEDGTDGFLQWLDVQGMLDIEQIHPAQPFSNTRYNHKRGPPTEARLEDIHPTLIRPLQEQMSRYGYDRWE